MCLLLAYIVHRKKERFAVAMGDQQGEQSDSGWPKKRPRPKDLVMKGHPDYVHIERNKKLPISEWLDEYLEDVPKQHSRLLTAFTSLGCFLSAAVFKTVHSQVKRNYKAANMKKMTIFSNCFFIPLVLGFTYMGFGVIAKDVYGKKLPYLNLERRTDEELISIGADKLFDVTDDIDSSQTGRPDLPDFKDR